MDTLATALYVRIDDLLKFSPHLAPWRPAVGISPRLSDAELVTLAVMQPLLGFTSEARWLRHAHAHLRHLFPYLPQQSGYNKRLRRAAELIRHAIRKLATDTALWTDDVWVVDSTPVECGRSRETAKRSDLAGWAQYGYCGSHSRFFWGLRLHLVCTQHGLPIALALTGAKAVEREVLLDIFAADPALIRDRPGQTLLADKNYYGRDFERQLADLGVRLLRPARKGEPERSGSQLFKPLRAADRVGQRHPQGPARPGTARRSNPRRSGCPCPATAPGPDRCYLAQPPDRPAGSTLPDRLRPLTLDSII